MLSARANYLQMYSLFHPCLPQGTTSQTLLQLSVQVNFHCITPGWEQEHFSQRVDKYLYFLVFLSTTKDLKKSKSHHSCDGNHFFAWNFKMLQNVGP